MSDEMRKLEEMARDRMWIDGDILTPTMLIESGQITANAASGLLFPAALRMHCRDFAEFLLGKGADPTVHGFFTFLWMAELNFLDDLKWLYEDVYKKDIPREFINFAGHFAKNAGSKETEGYIKHLLGGALDPL